VFILDNLFQELVLLTPRYRFILVSRFQLLRQVVFFQGQFISWGRAGHYHDEIFMNVMKVVILALWEKMGNTAHCLLVKMSAKLRQQLPLQLLLQPRRLQQQRFLIGMNVILKHIHVMLTKMDLMKILVFAKQDASHHQQCILVTHLHSNATSINMACL